MMLKYAVGGALLVAASQGIALSLGGVQGNVIIGRPLDVLVQASIDAAEAAAGPCVDAEVSYGDIRLSPSAVTVAIQRTGLNGTGALRVRAMLPVDEPIVSLVLRAGCTEKFTRSYALLADYEPTPAPSATAAAAALPVLQEAVAPLAPAPAAAAAPAPAPAAAPAQAAVAGPAGGAATAVAPASTPAVKSLPKPAAQPGTVDKAAKAAPAAKDKPAASAPVAKAPAAPRLKLDPIEPPAKPGAAVAPKTSEAKAPEAKPADTKAAAPAPTPATAVASAAPADAAAPSADAQKLLTMESELKGLRADQERLRKTLESVNSQLQQAEASRYDNPVVYGLGALLAAAVAGLVVALRARRNALQAAQDAAGPWWGEGGASTGATVLPEAEPEAPPPAPAPAAKAAPAPARPVVPDLPSMSGEAMAGLEVREPLTAQMYSDLAAPLESIDELLDLIQQVDFFISIGQDTDASDSLESFILRHPGASEAPYLLWLRHCLQRGDKAQIRLIGQLYEVHFSRPAPAEGLYADGAPGLDSDAAFGQSLTAVWPSRGAADLIEQALLSRPGAPSPLKVRTAQSFDDLALMHAVWTGVTTAPNTLLPVAAGAAAAAGGATGSAAATAAPTSGQAEPEAPLHASWETVSQIDEDEPDAPAAVPEASEELLDIDLSDIVGEAAVADAAPTTAPVAAPLPDIPVAATPAPQSEPEPEAKELPALDFDFSEFKSLKDGDKGKA